MFILTLNTFAKDVVVSGSALHGVVAPTAVIQQLPELLQNKGQTEIKSLATFKESVFPLATVVEHENEPSVPPVQVIPVKELAEYAAAV